MIECVICDLSEVLIAGLVGIEKVLSQELPVPQDKILPCFGGDLFYELLVGTISEDVYLRYVITKERWNIDTARLKAVIRHNFHNQVAGTLPIVTELAPRYELVLLSDHAREWIAYIQSVHSFLNMFEHTFFSYHLKKTKQDPGAFLEVLDTMSLPPRRCLFIDDNPTNVSVAESVGIPAIQFMDAGQLASELERWRL